MKKAFLFTLCFVIAWQLQAQKGYQGIKFEGHFAAAKPNINFVDKTTNTTVNGSTDQGISAGISVFTMKPIKNSVYYIFEAGFTLIGTNISHDVNNSRFKYDPKNMEVRLFAAQTFLGNIFSIYGGVVGGYNFSGKVQAPSDYTITKKLSPINASVAGGVQIIYNNFILGARYTTQITENKIAFTKTSNNNQQITLSDKPTYFTLSMGKIFKLNNQRRVR